MDIPKYLFEHGILTEQSDYRIHISKVLGSAFLFPTASGVLAIRENDYPHAPVKGKNGRLTALGYLVPLEDIGGLQEIPIPPFLKQLMPYEKDDTSQKGDKAAVIAMSMMHLKHIDLGSELRYVNDKDEQLLGYDVVLDGIIKVEIKFDKEGGTGRYHEPDRPNLYLQTHEINKGKKY